MSLPNPDILPCPHCAGRGGLDEEGYRKAMRCLVTHLLFEKEFNIPLLSGMRSYINNKVGLTVERMLENVRITQRPKE